MIRVWYSTESFADYIIDHTILKSIPNLSKKKMYESDANNPNNFHTLPDHIKKILYLDAPDLIVEYNSEPIFSIEISTEAGTGHNAFQRFARIAAAVENNVPAIYIYPEAAIITRRDSEPKWDKINPLVLKALESVMQIYNIPALLFYYPTDFRRYQDAAQSPNIGTKGLLYENNFRYAGCPQSTDSQMQKLFNILNIIIKTSEDFGVKEARSRLMKIKDVRDIRDDMVFQYVEKGGNENMSPLTATQVIPTKYLLNYLKKNESSVYKIGELLRSRPETLVYEVNASFRGDPYPGALSAIDYLKCREGETFEDRKYNLVLVWGKITINEDEQTLIVNCDKGTSINDFITDIKSCLSKNLLTKDYSQLKKSEIPRYYMQARYGSMYSKNKHIRVYSYFADAVLFSDGELWRDA